VAGTYETDTRVDGIVRETNLIVDNSMDGATHIKDSKLGEMHCLIDNTLTTKGSDTMQENSRNSISRIMSKLNKKRLKIINEL
jgi:hypothetical protein